MRAIRSSASPCRYVSCRCWASQTLLVTNAAGGLNPDFHAGDLMVISDQINLVGMAGHHPLVGPNDDTLGTPAFPDMSHVLRPGADGVGTRGGAGETGFVLRQGVYVCVSGPGVRNARRGSIPASSSAPTRWACPTAPEVTVARHAGMRILGLSGITNVAITDPSSDKETTHKEVLETGEVIAPRLMSLLRGVLAQLPQT